MTDYVALVRRVERLYRDVVAEPAEWTDARVAAWAGEMFELEPPGRDVARHVRKVMRVSRSLATFWLEPPDGVPDDAGDWRTRVDIAVGAQAWRPLLDLARLGLDAAPSPELFEEVKRRFRVVHHGHWMEGVSYEEWLATDRG